MGKVGIITHYYNSSNYGGNLQAYALCKALKNIGIEAEQISYPVVDHIHVKSKQVRKGIKKAKYIVRTVLGKLLRLEDALYILFNHKKYKTFMENQRTQVKAFEYFNKTIIPHSERIYNENSFPEAVNEYYAFITGSDQVWNYSWFQPAYFLEGIPSDIIKISYAASMGSNNLIDEQKEYFCRTLQDFKGISVREKEAAMVLSKMLDRKVEVVADPTLLLTSEDWDEVCSERIIEESYIFTYFLGNNDISRKISKDFSDYSGLKIVNIPMSKDKTHYIDEHFGDRILFDISPSDFISLIKHANYIFTDSFHATVFSYIYHKEVFIFNRDSNGQLKSRIDNIVDIFDIADRFCNESNKLQLDYIIKSSPIDYSDSAAIDEIIEKSYEYLKKQLYC